MNNHSQELLPQSLQRSREPGPILIGILFVFVLLVSGIRLQQAFALFERGTTRGQLLAVAMALCVEAAAVLAAYWLAQLRRREQPIPGVLATALVLSVAAPALANFAHTLIRTPEGLIRTGGLTLFWQILLGAVLSLLFPFGLVLAAEVLPEHLQKIDEENATMQRFYGEMQRRLVALEGEKAEREQFQQELGRQLGQMARLLQALAQQVGTLEGRLAEQAKLEEPASPPDPPSPEEPLKLWLALWEKAGGEPFDAGLAQAVFERGKTVVYNRLKEAGETGLVEKVRPGLYRFAVGSKGAVQSWIESQQAAADKAN
ncbi:MAG: hypothetical protein JXA37_12115 [Chloroflexia bacterium]|nr:hypothetical protein [Chloroflexia bacterium]